MRWVRTTLPCVSMTVTATGTSCLADSASARSAICFAIVSRSMVMSALPLEAQPAQGVPKSVLQVSRLLESLLQEGLDVLLRRWSLDGGHAGVPARSDLDVGRQAGFVHEALGVGDRPLVERGDPCRECLDEIVQLAIRQRTVHVAEALGIGASDVVCAQEHLEG